MKAYAAAMEKATLFTRKAALSRLAVEEKRISYAISLTEFETRMFHDPLDIKSRQAQAQIIATGKQYKTFYSEKNFIC